MLGERHEVESVTDGRQALARFESGKYDVVLIELGMSGLPGERVMARMREIDSQVVTALITGWTLLGIDPRAASFDFRLEKPFGDLAEVEDVVNRAIALRDRRVGGTEG